jgi:hypothetical protein
MTQAQPRARAEGNATLTRIAVALAALAVIQIVAMQLAGVHGPIWITQGVLAAVTTGVAWKAGGTTPRNSPAFSALVIGVVLLIAFAGFAIANA